MSCLDVGLLSLMQGFQSDFIGSSYLGGYNGCLHIIKACVNAVYSRVRFIKFVCIICCMGVVYSSSTLSTLACCHVV